MVAESSGVRSAAYSAPCRTLRRAQFGVRFAHQRGGQRRTVAAGSAKGSFCLFFDHTTSAVVCAHAAHDTCAVHHAYLHRIVYPLE